ASTVWTVRRAHGRISAAVLVPLAWVVLIPIATVIRPWVITPKSLFPDGFTRAAKDHLLISIAIANLAFAGFQWLILSGWFKSLQASTVAFFAARERPRAGRDGKNDGL